MATKKKKKISKIKVFLSYLFGWGKYWYTARAVFSPHLVFDFGWYQGETFRLFGLIIGNILWDEDTFIDYFEFFNLSIAHFHVSLVFYPYDVFVTQVDKIG